MAESVEFPRLADVRDLGYHPDLPPAGWYWRGLDDDALGPHVVVRCVHGNSATLGSKHGVAADGTVTPSIVFMRWDEASKAIVEGCCHVMGRLLGWTAEDAARPRNHRW